MEGVSDFDPDRTPPKGVKPDAPATDAPRRDRTGSFQNPDAPRRENTGSMRREPTASGDAPKRDRTGSFVNPDAPKREPTGSFRRENTGSSRAPEMSERERTGFRPRPYPPAAGARVRFPPPLVFIASIVLGGVIQQQIRFFLDLPSRACIAVGLLVAAGGIALVVWAGVFFQRTGQDPRPWKPKSTLIGQGPYAYTRNPMYLGMAIAQVGAGLALNNLWVAVLTGLSMALVHRIAVVPEEEYMETKFGDDYRRYKQAVRRY